MLILGQVNKSMKFCSVLIVMRYCKILAYAQALNIAVLTHAKLPLRQTVVDTLNIISRNTVYALYSCGPLIFAIFTSNFRDFYMCVM